MLFWLFLILLVVGIVLVVLAERNWKWDLGEALFGIGITTTLISAIALLIMVVIIISEYASVNGTLQQKRETYKALTYKIESEACRDEFGLLNKEIIDEVQEWNEDIVFNKTMQNNFWLGIFYPDIYDEFETIDYEKYAKE